jgi:hypothetical protein
MARTDRADRSERRPKPLRNDRGDYDVLEELGDELDVYNANNLTELGQIFLDRRKRDESSSE